MGLVLALLYQSSHTIWFVHEYAKSGAFAFLFPDEKMAQTADIVLAIFASVIVDIGFVHFYRQGKRWVLALVAANVAVVNAFYFGVVHNAAIAQFFLVVLTTFIFFAYATEAHEEDEDDDAAVCVYAATGNCTGAVLPCPKCGELRCSRHAPNHSRVCSAKQRVEWRNDENEDASDEDGGNIKVLRL